MFEESKTWDKLLAGVIAWKMSELLSQARSKQARSPYHVVTGCLGS